LSLRQEVRKFLAGIAVSRKKQGNSLKTNAQHFANGVEEPTMRVDLFLVLRLQNENKLNRNKIVGIISMRKNQPW